MLNARAGDLIKLCIEKYHPGLNQMFQAAGTPALDGGGVLGGPCHPSNVVCHRLVCLHIEGCTLWFLMTHTCSDR